MNSARSNAKSLMNSSKFIDYAVQCQENMFSNAENRNANTTESSKLLDNETETLQTMKGNMSKDKTIISDVISDLCTKVYQLCENTKSQIFSQMDMQIEIMKSSFMKYRSQLDKYSLKNDASSQNFRNKVIKQIGMAQSSFQCNEAIILVKKELKNQQLTAETRKNQPDVLLPLQQELQNQISLVRYANYCDLEDFRRGSEVILQVVTQTFEKFFKLNFVVSEIHEKQRIMDTSKGSWQLGPLCKGANQLVSDDKLTFRKINKSSHEASCGNIALEGKMAWEVTFRNLKSIFVKNTIYRLLGIFIPLYFTKRCFLLISIN